MDQKPKQLSDMIKSGEYYERSRDWYRTIYIGPVSERSFFLIIAVMAGLVSIMGSLALYHILPITEKPGILVSNDRLEDTIPRLQPLKAKREALNPALQEFFVKNYVTRREGYSAAAYDLNYKFLKAQSDDNAFAEYVSRYERANPNSPAAILGSTGQRVVEIESISINDKVEPRVATVEFSTEVQGINSGSRARWTAMIQYYYNDMVVTSFADPGTRVEKFETQDPQFKVVHYALTQTR